MSGYMQEYNRVYAQTAAHNIDRWREYCKQLEDANTAFKRQADMKDARIDAWSNHYAGLEAERDYLLQLLDEKCGGADKNPARRPAVGDYRIPHGPREGQEFQRRDAAYMRRIAEICASNATPVRDWWKHICDLKIFQ